MSPQPASPPNPGSQPLLCPLGITITCKVGVSLHAPTSPEQDSKASLHLKQHRRTCSVCVVLVFVVLLFWTLRPCCSVRASLTVVHRLLQRGAGSVVVVGGPSCSKARGILVLQPGIEPTCSALECGFLTTGLPAKSQKNLLTAPMTTSLY